VAGHLSEIRAKAWIAEYGIDTPRGFYARDVNEALAAIGRLRAPLAVKLVSSAVHKSEIGGVRTGVADDNALRAAITDIATTARRHDVIVDGFLVEEMAPKGVEILVGGLVDRVFGPAVLVGLGGVFTEVLNDVVARICPIDGDEAREMIEEMKCAPLLHGARGQPAANVDALCQVLVALGGRDGLLVQHAQTVLEIDLNPVIVSPQQAIAVDARIMLREATSRAV
jgi:succinyl-CoA synthetase beta subunit